MLEGIVSEFNLTWGDKHKVRLEIVKWETHSYPSFGEDGQDVINNQVGDDYDIFLGIMWGRFGTKTKSADSGTEEEFYRAYSRLKNGDKVQIMFYFKDAGIPPSQMIGEQVVKVQSFKQKISDEYGGLYYQFETTDDFQTKARIHLSKVVQDWLSSNSSEIEAKTVMISEEISRLEPVEHNPLANFTALGDNNTDEDLFDLVDLGTDAMNEVVLIVERMTEATNTLGNKFTQRTNETNELTKSGKIPDRKSVRRVANNAANDLDVFVKRMFVEIPEFYKQNSIFTDSFSKIAMLSSSEFKQDKESIQHTLASLKGYQSAIDSNVSSLAGFRRSIYNLPNMTTLFNQARRRAVAIMDDLLSQLLIASSQLKDIEGLLVRHVADESKD